MSKIKLLFLTTTLFVSLNSISQIKKIESKAIKKTKIAPGGSFWASIDYYKDYVVLTFDDAEYQITNLVSCALDYKTMNGLYDLLLTKDSKKGDQYDVTTIDNSTVKVIFKKSIGTVYPVLYLYENEFDRTPSRMPAMTKRQLRKLFDKKKKKKKKD